MGDDTPTLRGEGLTRAYGQGDLRTLALDDVSVALYAGQVVLLMGPSGSGKSTLLAVLSGLLKPDRGRVFCLGEELTRLSDRKAEQFRRKHVGFVFQGYNLFPALTAQQQLEMVLKWGEGVSSREARRRATAMLDQFGLANKTDLLPPQLSGGEKQRVALGRALVKKPEILFADEPTSALDWAHGKQVAALLRSAAHDRNATVLVVSHDQRLEAFADRVIHMEDGRLLDSPMPHPHPAPQGSFVP